MKSQVRTGRKVRFVAVFLLLAIQITGCSRVGAVSRGNYQDLVRDELEFKPEKPESWTTAQGLTVYYRHDDEVPLINIKLYFPGGSLYEPANMIGLASATGSQMREGGIAGFTPEALDQKLDSLAAGVESGFADEFGTVGFTCLKEDFPEVSRIFAGIVRHPAFDETRFQLWRKLSLEGIKRRKDSPETMAGMSFDGLLYGFDSPYARAATEETIKAITIRDMQKFHERFVRPAGAIMTVSGAISRAEVEAMLEHQFGDWRGPQGEPLQYPAVDKKPAPGVYVLNRNFDQATVILGHIGPKRLTPDAFAMGIFNRLFGSGGFESVLFSEIRSRLGLAYSIQGGLSPGPVAGSFQVIFQSRAAESLRAVKRVVELVRETHEEVPEVKRVAASKAAVENGFVFKFAGADGIVSRSAYLNLLHYPEDFDATYLEKTRQVDGEAVREVARRWVKPEELMIIIVGPVTAEAVREALPGLPVHMLEFETVPRLIN